jgi:hypothetical protein
LRGDDGALLRARFLADVGASARRRPFFGEKENPLIFAAIDWMELRLTQTGDRARIDAGAAARPDLARERPTTTA